VLERWGREGEEAGRVEEETGREQNPVKRTRKNDRAAKEPSGIGSCREGFENITKRKRLRPKGLRCRAERRLRNSLYTIFKIRERISRKKRGTTNEEKDGVAMGVPFWS